MDKLKLKTFALVLESELSSAAAQSKEVAAFAEYEPLVTAIGRAKAEEITEPYELPGMRYWLFETNISDYKSLDEALARFRLLLSGWDITADGKIVPPVH